MSKKRVETLEQSAERLGLATFERHAFFCVGESCCNANESAPVWDALKDHTRELAKQGKQIYRTKVGCLRVCQKGPLMLVYPEGVWYSNVNLANLQRIVDEHFVGGRVVEDLVFAKSELNWPK
jgi:(2Fe-2S) ferredoxin